MNEFQIPENNDIGTTTGFGFLFNSTADGFNSSLHCYDLINEMKGKRLSLWFWLEGVLLFAVGMIGLLCNILAIIVLNQNPDNNSSFNMLLI